jgi:hypothetical protein
MLMGSLALRTGEVDALDRWSIAGGRIGSWLLIAMNAYAAWLLSTDGARADRYLVAVGSVVGLLAAILYLRVSSAAGSLRQPYSAEHPALTAEYLSLPVRRSYSAKLWYGGSGRSQRKRARRTVVIGAEVKIPKGLIIRRIPKVMSSRKTLEPILFPITSLQP